MQLKTIRNNGYLVCSFPAVCLFLILLWLCVSIAGTCPAIGSGQGKKAGAEGMNLLIITLDTMRADRIGAYG